MRARRGTSLVARRLRLCAPSAGGLGSIPGQGTRSHWPKRRVHMPQLRPGTARWIQIVCLFFKKPRGSELMIQRIMRGKKQVVHKSNSSGCHSEACASLNTFCIQWSINGSWFTTRTLSSHSQCWLCFVYILRHPPHPSAHAPSHSPQTCPSKMAWAQVVTWGPLLVGGPP